MPRRLILLAAPALAAAAAPPAHAMTVRLGQPNLTARVSIALPVFVTCTPFDPGVTLNTESVNVTVEQAVGKQIAHGFGGFMAFNAPGGPPLPFACDGAEHEIPVTVAADASGAPFKRDK